MRSQGELPERGEVWIDARGSFGRIPAVLARRRGGRCGAYAASGQGQSSESGSYTHSRGEALLAGGGEACLLRRAGAAASYRNWLRRKNTSASQARHSWPWLEAHPTPTREEMADIDSPLSTALAPLYARLAYPPADGSARTTCGAVWDPLRADLTLQILVKTGNS